MNKLEIFQEVYGKDYVFTETELSRLLRIAELIVRECAEVIEICSHSNCYSGHEFSFAKESIKKHFGVEE